MTSKRTDQSYGLPPPITKLTVEQDLKMRVIEDKLKEAYHDNKDDIIMVFMALQKQNFVLANSLQNLIQQWPKPPIALDQNTINEVLPMFGILLENKD